VKYYGRYILFSSAHIVSLAKFLYNQFLQCLQVKCCNISSLDDTVLLFKLLYCIGI